MSVLLLRLAGPLQAWGSAARFVRRTTENAPTKSGVLGLLAAAEGRPREADLSDLAALRYGVRVDQPGTRTRDFQTARHFVSGKSMPLSERFYLADAVFVAAVEGDRDDIHRLHAAVQEPVYLPYLGRRSCPPAAPLDLGVRDDVDLIGAMEQAPWQASPWYRARTRTQGELTLLVDSLPGETPELSLRDEPLSFDPRHRRYGLRGISSRPVTAPDPGPARQPYDHDPTSVLGTA
ncbi:type I-E CRISPR-associated protein Cas5/CasD [Streptomyces sp. NBC_01477]|uniref:type I-E CRISPR-associated protein Cas5/CasD n=1 Tax=Streptomyces sp. NBC_01477 TaxID=2976015 RepID=UPI002E338572|nr:type I-E CRISPR-associated protein Cas5/CasD [Streptomyces sp. NBC_01477]